MKAVALWGEAKRLHDGHASWRNPLTGDVILVFFSFGEGACPNLSLPTLDKSIYWLAMVRRLKGFSHFTKSMSYQ